MTARIEAPGTAGVLDERQPRWGLGIGYLPGIDGIRALSALAVVAYHLELSWAAGGYLGVEVFFVVSGYLITRLLLDEHRRTDAVDLMGFWLRRARRLLPAVGGLLALVSLWSLLVVGGDDFSRFRGDAVASLLYVQNWHAIITDQPYFSSFGRPSPLRHMWSLAIEEQFYLLWPLLLPLGLRRFGRRRTALVTVVAALVSVLLMSVHADIAAPERAYYGTDTRAFGILIGAVLAFGWRPERLRAEIPSPARRVIDGVGLAALLMLLWQLGHRSEFDPWTYPQGFLLVDLCTVLVLVAATHPASRMQRQLGARPLAALGRRSYSLYLWHWPVIVYTRPDLDWPLDGAAALVARLALIAGLTECSYRFIEQPFRDGRARAGLRAMSQRLARRRWLRLIAASIIATSMGALTAVVAAPPPVQQIEATRAPSITTTSTTRATTTTTPATPTTTAPATPADVASAPASAPSTRQITVIGESVTLGAAGTLRDHYGDRVAIDAVEGRSVRDGIELVEQLAEQSQLRPTVVVHIGNNGAIPPGGLERVADAVGSERVLVLVTVRVPRRWEAQVNDEIRRIVSERPAIRLADWHAITGAESGLLVDDGVHLTDAGQQRYAQMLTAIEP